MLEFFSPGLHFTVLVLTAVVTSSVQSSLKTAKKLYKETRNKTWYLQIVSNLTRYANLPNQNSSWILDYGIVRFIVRKFDSRIM